MKMDEQLMQDQVGSLLKDAKIITEIDMEQARAYLTVDELIKKQHEQEQLQQLQASEGQGQLSLQPEGVENVLRECSADEPTFYNLTPLQTPNYTQGNPEYTPLASNPIPAHQVAQLGEHFFIPELDGLQEPVNFVQNNSSDEPLFNFEEIHDFQCADEEQSVQPAAAAGNNAAGNMGGNQSGGLMANTTVLPSVRESFQFYPPTFESKDSRVKATRGRKKRQSPVEFEQAVGSFRGDGMGESPNCKKAKISMEELLEQIKIMQNDPNHDPAELRKLKNNEACRNHRDKRKNEGAMKDAELQASKKDNECLKVDVQRKDETIKRLKGVLQEVQRTCPNITPNLKQKINTVLIA